MRGHHVLAVSFVALAAIYVVLFNTSTRIEPDAAWSRFESLSAAGYDGRAVVHGDRALRLWREMADAAPRDVHSRQLEVADAHYRGGKPMRAIEEYAAALSSAQAASLTDDRRIEIRRRIAELDLAQGNAARPALIAARFLERSGDALANHKDRESEGEQRFLDLVDAMRPGFTDVLPADGSGRRIDSRAGNSLEIADAMTTVGGYYALEADGAYAAAGLLSSAHSIRESQLGPDHADTIQTALLLAPVYERIDRLSDAEDLYEQVFQAVERTKGSNNPELSLYIRLLSGIYEKQGRLTEAEALNRHMRQIFRDAFGARRYAANRSRDRLFDINRPVSASFPLEADYIPPDLVRAADFGIPLSKSPTVEEMQMRLAKIDGTSMPESLAGLLEACSSEGERLTLRSAYRSHRTQRVLHRINKDKGTVADPGTSEHQLGLAADIDVNRRFMRATDRAYSCFEKKAWQYGFILSFPQGNTYLPGADSYEPWHWRFVGPRTALLYREIGPWGMPQEFLSVLPCYEERALSGLFVDRERGDICIESLTQSASSESEERGT
ncbi:D-alanyl-D-alanine carboxypeptidase family protein [Parvularcula lutaonensis]|uniref:D-alanyl-D-alanine carboxypeptidase family protein n=1 Tax=Parvularcula lutaonensis TaxID=491923 RepID=A0ABV7MBW6_9PROT|nr:D-alanyl-D-alanine carboxypeptidase family protein [Parvularcula lutaonensis]GGY40849.1 hypothetical protein GCM10007148_06770 [Parvularcula lutaonensis]